MAFHYPVFDQSTGKLLREFRVADYLEAAGGDPFAAQAQALHAAAEFAADVAHEKECAPGRSGFKKLPLEV